MVPDQHINHDDSDKHHVVETEKGSELLNHVSINGIQER